MIRSCGRSSPGSSILYIVYEARAILLGHALTIWRWGRQQSSSLDKGKPLGSYEAWAQWCRDPLINLDVRDPIDRLGAIKAADPKRRRIETVFVAWAAIHGDVPVFASGLDWSVIQAIDEKSGIRDGVFHYSRQFVATWLQRHINTRVGGYVLTSIQAGHPSKPVYCYKLTSTGEQVVP
jgi:hypothetical protein